MVGVVVVSHSADIARGVVDLAGQMAGEEVRLEGVGGDSHGTLGTDEVRVRKAIGRADQEAPCSPFITSSRTARAS